MPGSRTSNVPIKIGTQKNIYQGMWVKTQLKRNNFKHIIRSFTTWYAEKTILLL